MGLLDYRGMKLSELRTDEIDVGVNCILCGNAIPENEAVRYRGWICHESCANEVISKQLLKFDRRLLLIGGFGGLVGLVLTIPIIITVFSAEEFMPFLLQRFGSYNLFDLSYVQPGFDALFTAIAILVMCVGFYGIYKNYNESLGLLTIGVGLATSISYVTLSSIIFTLGPDPVYHDPVTSHIIWTSVPGFYYTTSATLAMFGIFNVIIGIMFLFLEDEMGKGNIGRLKAISFIVVGGALWFLPITKLVHYVLVVIVFLTAGIPESWSDTSPLRPI
jgi:hypothetical protein